MRSFIRNLVTLGLVALFVAMVWPQPAQAATEAYEVASDCHEGWYVNHDEQDLAPTQEPGGFLFDGPSLVHRAITPVKLAEVATPATFMADVTAGVAPLFKFETMNPYSTINVRADGKVWSSKIASGPGSQADPVASVALLPGIAPYTNDSAVYSIGVGYANDTGNTALVSQIIYGPDTWDLTCEPEQTPSPSGTTSASPNTSPSEPGATVTTSPPAVGELPRTGPNAGLIAGAGIALVVGGVVALVVVTRLRRDRYVS